MTMVLQSNPVQQFHDQNGVPLAGAQLFLYAAGTTTKQAAFTDSSGATALPNPVVLNVRGEVAPSAQGTSCGLWLDPTLSYKFVLAPANDTDPPTAPIWTVDNVVSAQSAIQAQLAQYMATITGVPVGAMVPYGGTTPPSGWLLCYGQAVSRTTYAALFAALGTAYGAGDGSTTFNLPDKRGRISVGLDNMGGSAANNVTNAGCGINAAVQGTRGGSQYAQQDTLTATNTVNTAVTDPGHKHKPLTGYFIENGTVAGGGGGNFLANSPTTDTAFTGISVTTTVSTVVTSALQGQSQNMPPLEVDSWIIFTGVAS